MALQGFDVRGGDRVARAVAFVLAAALVSYYALRGGSYDTVVWQEEAIAVWWVLALGYGLGLLPRSWPPRAILVPLGALAALVALALTSLAWTSSAERTVTEAARLAHYGGLLLLVASLVDGRTWRPAAMGLAAGSVLVSGLAIASRLLPDAFPADVVNEVFEAGRLNYPFDYWNALAAWSAMALAMALAWSAHARLPLLRAAWLAAVPVCGLAIYLTYSRGGIVSAALGIGAVLLLSRHRWTLALNALGAAAATVVVILVARSYPAISEGAEGTGAGIMALALVGAAVLCAATAWLVARTGADGLRLPRRTARMVTAGAATLAAAGAFLVAGGSVSSAWESFTETAEPSASAPEPEARLVSLGGPRYEYWSVALGAFAAHPAGGIGPGTYEFRWTREGDGSFARDAHSLYLEQLAELGLGGAVLVVLLIAGLVLLALRARAMARPIDTAGGLAALSAVLIVFAFQAGIDWLWEMTAVTALALAAAALAMTSTSRATASTGTWLRAAVVVVALGAVVLQLPGLVSTSNVRDSQVAFRQGNAAAAFAAANDAVSAQPWGASGLVQRALLAESAGRLGAAREDLLRAIEREPTNWRHHTLLARVEAERGAVGAALAAYRDARRLGPDSFFARH